MLRGAASGACRTLASWRDGFFFAVGNQGKRDDFFAYH